MASRHRIKISYAVFQIYQLPNGRKITRFLGYTSASSQKEAIRNVMYREYGRYHYETAVNCDQIAVAVGSSRYNRLMVVSGAKRRPQPAMARQRVLFPISSPG